MPIPSPGTYDVASQTTLVAVKAKTDLIPADIATQLDTNIPEIKARTDLLNAYIHIPLYPMRGAAVAGTWVYNIDAAISAYSRDLLGATVVPGNLYNSTNAQNDEYKYPKIALPAGEYSLEFYYYRNTNCGILTVRHGAALLGTIDTYGASGANIIGVINFTIAADTIADIRYIAASKNAASVGYYLSIQSAILWRRS